MTEWDPLEGRGLGRFEEAEHREPPMRYLSSTLGLSPHIHSMDRGELSVNIE